MDSIKRGDVFLLNFDPTMGSEIVKTRPALVVSNDINNTYSPIISIAPTSSQVARVYSFEVEVSAGTAGLRSRGKIMVNQTRAVGKVRRLKRMGRLTPEKIRLVDQALKLHYDLN